MWWECTQCVAGGNSPWVQKQHEDRTGHVTKAVADVRIEENS